MHTMSKITHITLLIISGWMLLLAANSCINDDSDLSEAIAVYQIQPEIVEVDSTALLEDSDVVVTDINDKAYSDYVENTNWTRSVYIHFDGDTAYVTNNESGVTTIANGAHLIVVNTKKRCNSSSVAPQPMGHSSSIAKRNSNCCSMV